MKSKEVDHRGYHADHPEMVNPSVPHIDEFDTERSFIIHEMTNSEENKTWSTDGSKVRKEEDLFRTVQDDLRRTRKTVSVLDSNIRRKMRKRRLHSRNLWTPHRKT
ncbi:MAG: hypothetical protein ABEJ03_00905 [Candidatus Nanohaloarchaea archaeon]